VKHWIPTAALVLAACDAETGGVALLPPDDVELHWDSAFNADDDGLVGVVTVDVMVYEALTGAPLDDVAVVLDAERARILLPEAVAPADDRCSPDEPCDDVVWDASQDRYLVVYAPSDEPVTLWTDADGIGRATVYVDAFPTEGGAFAPVEIAVGVAGTDARAVFSLVPQ
jgi:hypothetical protein